MTFDEYQEAAVKTAIYPERYTILYPALGLAGEAGEVSGKVKKVLRDNDGVFSETKKAEIADELGDVMWYAAALASDLGISLNEIVKRNIDKLLSRQQRGVLSGSGDKR